MKKIILVLNSLLLALAVIVAATLLKQGNAWVWITAYWLVTVVKNALQLVKEAK